MANHDPFADDKGRDEFLFEPIVSPYLEAAGDLRLRTPYSRVIVQELKQVPWAHWDDELRIWRIPYRSLRELRRRWPTIEAEAHRNEPEERKLRALAERGSAKYQEKRSRQNERRRRRYPIPQVFPPMLNRPVTTVTFGIVVCTEVSSDVVPATFASFYPFMKNSNMEFVWATWRTPTLAELLSAWPSRTEEDHQKGWWLPTLAELREVRKLTRSRERTQSATKSLRPSLKPDRSKGL